MVFIYLSLPLHFLGEIFLENYLDHMNYLLV